MENEKIILELNNGEEITNIENAEKIEVSENKKRGRSRKSGKVSDKLNLDFFVTLFTLFIIGYVLYQAVFITIHTNIDLSKNEKGEISLIIDYNENNEVETPGQNIWPMVEEVLNALKK